MKTDLELREEWMNTDFFVARQGINLVQPKIQVADWFISQRHTDMQTLIEEIEGKKKDKENGEGLPFENSPEIYGNQRIRSYKKGYNQAIDDILASLKDNTQV